MSIVWNSISYKRPFLFKIDPKIGKKIKILLWQIDKKYEYPRQDLLFGELLGEGQFGRVVAANAFNIGDKLGYTKVTKVGDGIFQNVKVY